MEYLSSDASHFISKGQMSDSKFRLSDKFVEQYKEKKPPFGFNGLGEITYIRTYSRRKPDGTNEKWWETCRRVVEGTYNMQKMHIDSNNLGWNAHRAQRSAQEMYDRIFNMKFLPPGRGLWAMGSSIIEERGLNAALNNCSFVSTSNLKDDPSMPFCFLMDMSMLGVGVGFDCRGEAQIKIIGPNKRRTMEVYTIPDSREGWVDSLKMLLESYFLGVAPVKFDYSQVRKEGEPILGFGGVASGPEPLIEMHESIRDVLERETGQLISVTTIVDIMNLIGRCVVAGGVRRTSEIVFHNDTDEYLALKDYSWNGERYVGLSRHRASYGWTSNNSIFAQVGMDYGKVATQTSKNGEPGYLWLDNARDYSRMCDSPDYKDKNVMGANPCFSGDTLIAVADGRTMVPIRDLATIGADVPVYSLNSDGKVEIKWARSPRKTRSSVQMVRVTFDDDSFLDVTPDHNFMLMDGSDKQAKDLVFGDSLPRFTKRKEQMSLDNPNQYWRVYCDVYNNKESKPTEHRLIFEFFNPGVVDALCVESKKNGWCKGGVVIHHRDYDGLNNSPNNLEAMLFEDHRKLHSSKDFIGDNNPMYGRRHSDATKKLIGLKTRERCLDPEYLEKFRSSFSTETRLKLSDNMKKQKKDIDKRRYLRHERETDFSTIWVGDKLFVQKICQSCGTELILEWSYRNREYCSISCANVKQESIENRKCGQRKVFSEKQKSTLHKQIMIFRDLSNRLGRVPTRGEWENACKDNDIPHRLRSGYTGSNPYVFKSYRELKERAETYNHSVKSVVHLEGEHDVYNLTVDDNHTVGVITSVTDTTLSGIYLHQCNEQSLFDGELCTLVETFPFRHTDMQDYLRTLKFAYLYAKTVTLGKTHWPITNRVMLKNRRIGCSMSGIVQFISKYGLDTLRIWCERGYDEIKKWDEIYSDWFAIPKSIKVTSIKPSGTVSLLAGATPGMHFPEARFYIRRVRLQRSSSLVDVLKDAGYKVEPSVNERDTMVVEIPVDVGEGIRSVSEVSMWEQLLLAAFLQKYWADNQVSVTVSFDPDTEGHQIKYALNYFQYQLKGVSFLPRTKAKVYAQMPYEAIDEETYKKLVKALKKPKFNVVKNEEVEIDRFCNNDSCEVKIAEAV